MNVNSGIEVVFIFRLIDVGLSGPRRPEIREQLGPDLVRVNEMLA